MSENSIVIKWAGIGVALYLILGIIGYLINLEVSFIISFIVGLIILFPILMASFDFRDKFNNSFARLGQIFFIGFKITLVIALVAGIWGYIYPNFFNENFIEQQISQSRIALEEYGMADADIDENIKMSMKFMTPVMFGVINFIKILIFGLFVSLVSGLTIRNEKPLPELNIEEN